eukprot:Blabericola_migrator_1__3660@NODE_2097_length_3280_cov_145_455960_g1328_i0_p1_GENE_NODE_2097_length_3280_cov_145_455960_g1328_i0NODE_2097_length_3280_cov_145_455960_g1328_i0_p1_ORF_typecomplete_len373_score50_12Branch/PF02485_21/2_6e09_NODE_2097_length_3280_cov_145_455960_g1328_i021083226
MKLSLFPFLCALLSAVEEDPAASLTQPWDESKPFGLAFLISLERDLETATLWERWIQDAFTYIHEAGIEDSKVPMNESQILRFFINYSPVFTRDTVQDFLPPSLKYALIEPPAECVWRNLNPCDYRLYIEAHRMMPTAEYFILMSHNSAPLKTFSYMYEEAKKDRRIRTAFVTENFKDGVPKSTRWRAEPRKVVDVRLWDSYWVSLGWMTADGGARLCGPDECAMWRPVANYFGAKMLSLFKPDHLNKIQSYFMFDCWNDQPHCTSVFTGDRAGAPFKWTTMDPAFLDELLTNPDRWIFRKVSDTTLVHGTKDLVIDRIDHTLGLRHNYNKVFQRPPHEALPRMHDADIVKQRLKYKQMSLPGIRDRIKNQP